MKNQFSLLIITLSVLAVACQKPAPEAAKPALDEAAETAAIMKVIENETKNFFDGNYEAWASNWSHENYAMQAWNNRDGSADAAMGWEKINAQGKMWIETYYKNGENIIHPVVKRDSMVVKFFNDKAAYLIWKQLNANKEKTFYRISRESRLMEKQADGWKIVNVSAFWDTDPQVPFYE